VSHHLTIPIERVRVVQGDTDLIATGAGTGGSSSIPVGGVAVERAARRLADNLLVVAADVLEAGTSDLEFADGGVRIAGTDRMIMLAELARAPGAFESRLTAADTFKAEGATFPNGTHVVEVEIDPETGVVTIVRHVIVDDVGVTLNPLLLAGQIHGGTVQSIGQALMERTVYDRESGQLLTATLQDYAIPRAADVPFFAFETRNVPCRNNPLGVKGVGEAGTIGATPAVMNAVVDALWRAAGIRHIDMPTTAERVWAALREARAGS
jgi:carbon-monoxide dehydrogenase large subunit